MSKQQKNSAFIKMLKEFPKAFGRVSFRERLMLKTAFTYVLEARYEDKDSVERLLGERCNQLLKDKGVLTDKVAELGKQAKDLEWQLREVAKDNDNYQAENERLEKENAELKNKDCWKSCEYANPKAELIEQHIKDVQILTKAKEILKRFIETSNPIYFEEDRQKVKAQAEQFLEEIEK